MPYPLQSHRESMKPPLTSCFRGGYSWDAILAKFPRKHGTRRLRSIFKSPRKLWFHSDSKTNPAIKRVQLLYFQRLRTRCDRQAFIHQFTGGLCSDAHGGAHYRYYVQSILAYGFDPDVILSFVEGRLMGIRRDN